MNRLTQKRVNGIKTGYWSASKKDDLVARLAEYEDTGLEPREVLQLKKNAVQRIPVTERLPDPESYILVSFENFSLPDIATYRVDEDGSGAFYLVMRLYVSFCRSFCQCLDAISGTVPGGVMP